MEQPVPAPAEVHDLARAEKSAVEEEPEVLFRKERTSEPAQPRQPVFPSDFKDDEDEGWFLRTGQPAPMRESAVEAAGREEPVVETVSTSAVPFVVIGAGLFGAIVLALGWLLWS